LKGEVLRRFLKQLLPLLAMFLAGSAVAVFATADPASCDWSRSGNRSVSFLGSGAETPERALKELHKTANISIPSASLEATSGDNRYAETAVDKVSGAVSYAIYIDGVHRMQVTVERLADGTFYPTGFETCYGV
jgi:hypothetical protein